MGSDAAVKNLLIFTEKDHMKEDWMRTDSLLPLPWCWRTSPDSLSLHGCFD